MNDTEQREGGHRQVGLAAGLETQAIRTSLAEMDRTLRELQEELAVSPRARASAAAPAPPAPPSDPPGSASAVAGLPSAAVIEAQTSTRRILEQAVSQLAAIRAQIDELLVVRDRLVNSMRQLIADAEATLGPIVGAEATPPAAAVPSTAPAPNPIPTPVAQAPADADGELDDEQEREPERPMPPALMHGQITLAIGPLPSISSIGVLEQSLQQMPGIESVAVRGFDNRDAVVELVAETPVDVPGGLRAALPYSLLVVEGDEHNLRLAVEPAEQEIEEESTR